MTVAIDARRPDLGGNIRHGDTGTWAPKIWNYLIDRFAISSSLDVGCGEGHCVKFFHKKGIISHGVDGLMANIERAVFPISWHDILEAPYVMPVDFVWSCEVAEHIMPAKVGNYVDTLCNGKIIAMTHALPGQTGHNHVNCQPPEYWIDLMKAKGYSIDRSNELYEQISSRDEHFNYFAKTGLVFLRD
jgi:hypothetical protein